MCLVEALSDFECFLCCPDLIQEHCNEAIESMMAKTGKDNENPC